MMNEKKSMIKWESIKEKMFLHLVNYERNKADLEGKVYHRFLDLVILIHCDGKEGDCDGFYVNQEHLLMWKQDRKDVFQTALKNTSCKSNTFVIPLMNLMPQEAEYEMQDEMDIGMEDIMMVLTNESLSYGASMLLNIPVLKKLADQFSSNLYLLPSSVHEIIAICLDQSADISWLTDMVNTINHYVVEPKDYLSDNIYYFDRETCKVTVAVPV